MTMDMKAETQKRMIMTLNAATPMYKVRCLFVATSFSSSFFFGSIIVCFILNSMEGAGPYEVNYYQDFIVSLDFDIHRRIGF